MLYTIENEHLKISVNNVGAELTSVESVKSGKQFMWSGDPAFWANHSPVLFPIVGGLKGNIYYVGDQAYTLPRHGFIRNNAKISLIHETDSSLTFGLKSDTDSLKVYPFDFEFEITYTLYGHRVVVSHKVKNPGNTDIFFSVGAHPAFRCPLNENESYEDYYLEFEHNETDSTWLLTAEGLVSDKSTPVLKNTNVLHLTPHLFDNDALIFKNLKSRRVSLRSTKSQQVISLYYEDFPYLGLWAKPGASFICIEPWLGIADHEHTDQKLETKEGIINLKPHHIFEAAYSIEVSE